MKTIQTKRNLLNEFSMDVFQEGKTLILKVHEAQQSNKQKQKEQKQLSNIFISTQAIPNIEYTKQFYSYLML